MAGFNPQTDTAELIEWAQQCLAWTGIPVWCVADGADAKRPFLKRAMAAGVVVVSPLSHLDGIPVSPQLERAH